MGAPLKVAAEGVEEPRKAAAKAVEAAPKALASVVGPVPQTARVARVAAEPASRRASRGPQPEQA